MKALPRIYGAMLDDHLANYRQMAFVSGPHQVGKTTAYTHDFGDRRHSVSSWTAVEGFPSGSPSSSRCVREFLALSTAAR